MSLLKIQKYSDSFRQQLLSVWEASVLATHHFLKPEDFLSIKEAVTTIDFTAFDVYCMTRNSMLVGFVGLAERKVEMLFVSPDCFRQGIGGKLMDFAIRDLKANQVDVNEQNSDAVRFYSKLGFVVYERTGTDDQGKNYPLLRMKLPAETVL